MPILKDLDGTNLQEGDRVCLPPPEPMVKAKIESIKTILEQGPEQGFTEVVISVRWRFPIPPQMPILPALKLFKQEPDKLPKSGMIHEA